MIDEQIKAIRDVRTAAHELENVCRALVGGVEMSISSPTVGTLGEEQSKIVSHPAAKEK